MSNIFALVEIKFQGDRIEEAQFGNYERLRVQCAKAKKVSTVTASEGFKLSMFRYPEDVSPRDQSEQQKQKKSKGVGQR